MVVVIVVVVVVMVTVVVMVMMVVVVVMIVVMVVVMVVGAGGVLVRTAEGSAKRWLRGRLRKTILEETASRVPRGVTKCTLEVGEPGTISTTCAKTKMVEQNRDMTKGNYSNNNGKCQPAL